MVFLQSYAMNISALEKHLYGVFGVFGRWLFIAIIYNL